MAYSFLIRCEIDDMDTPKDPDIHFEYGEADLTDKEIVEFKEKAIQIITTVMGVRMELSKKALAEKGKAK